MKSADARHWLEALFDESPVAIAFSRDGIVLDANREYVHMFGYATVDELRGKSLLEQVAPSSRAYIVERIAQRAQGDHVPSRYEVRGLRRDGTELAIDVATTRVILADGPLTIAFVVDASERERALEALRASEERFRTLSEAAFEGVIIHGDGVVLLANDAAAKMYGVADPRSIVGVSVMDLTAPESRATVADRVRQGASGPYQGLARRKDGSTFHAEVLGRTLVHQGRPARVAIVRDITERKRAEAEQRALAERVQQAQKLESLGVLAGGVAHDFNNILTVISNGLALAKGEVTPDSVVATHLDAIALAAERAADLCQQMLSYAGKAQLIRSTLDLNALVREMASMLTVSIAKKVSLACDLAATDLTLVGDATQIRQIVMNLVVNASEAIAGSAGTIHVTTGVGAFEAGAFARSAAGGEPKAGTYVWLEVRDDGVGMDTATVAQMFDPFFTTKFVGRGLGMAAVLGIVRSHAGAIDVESDSGRGTRVRVFFPAASGHTVSPVSPSTTAPTALRGSGVVLVVDDEKNVRITTQLLLERFGFEVLVAKDGLEAVETFRHESERISAVLLDLTMPRMDGVATIQELRRIAPQVPVVLVSGYGVASLESSRRDPQTKLSPDAILPKPYTPDLLFATLQRVIGFPTTEAPL